MSAPEPTLPTLEEAERRLAEIEKQLAEVVPALQAEAVYIRGYIAGLTRPDPETET
jgi:hypothetical protein